MYFPYFKIDINVTLTTSFSLEQMGRGMQVTAEYPCCNLAFCSGKSPLRFQAESEDSDQPCNLVLMVSAGSNIRKDTQEMP